MKITSVNNDLVKEAAKLLRGKYREETGLFLIEGEKGVKRTKDRENIACGFHGPRFFIFFSPYSSTSRSQ